MSDQEKRIVCYATGHGYGHAARIADLLRVLVPLKPKWRFWVCTSAPAWLYDEFSEPTVTVVHDRIDTGACEADNSLVIDGPATINSLMSLLSERDAIIQRHAEWLRSLNASAVIADIPFLAGEIAEQAGVPCIGIGNFLWDFIYEPLLEGMTERESSLEVIRHGYSKMSLMLRLPFCHDMSIFDRMVDVPLITGRSSKTTSDVRHWLEIPYHDSRPIVYFGVRGAVQPEILIRAARSIPDFILVSVGKPIPNVPENVRLATFDSDVGFADFIAACDIAVTKPGYGMYAACVANQVRILYPPRQGFREDDYLLRVAPRYTPTMELSLSDFHCGEWGSFVRSLHSQSIPAEKLAANGAEVCSQRIVDLIENRE